MISSTDRAQIYHPGNRGFLFIDHSEADVGQEDRHYQWRAPATAGHRWARDVAERFLHEKVPAASQWLQEQFVGCIVIQAPICACCGDVAFRDLTCVRPDRDPAVREYRCTKHRDRNPCVVEGCQRTRAANGQFGNDLHICGEHWKRYVPVGSTERQAFNRLARLAKKAGYARTARWPDALERRWWRLWYGTMRRVRARSNEGRMDVAEINKLFGWDDAA